MRDNKGRFIKGYPSWNKGKKRTWKSPSEFKRGHKVNLGRKRPKWANNNHSNFMEEWHKTHEHPRGMLGKKLSKEHIRILREANKGKKSHLWRGGISYNPNYDYGFEWRQIRKQVWGRDNYTCQVCGKTNCRVETHHIIPFRISKDNSLENLITLCSSCHQRVELGVVNV